MTKLDIINEIGGGAVRWSSHADVDGNVTKHPYIKVYNASEGREIVNSLKDRGIEAELDCYEADDGDDDYGRPIILNFWSVKIKNYA